ncbi:ComF family protein [Leptospira semungkisensis]|uniref:ComF family protein n=1 Tax=Leptospira semungkisensis TaxID=2484985 RepID=A0A4R9G9Q1_9LEPT|nr:double zinc ribbon domain-containing protein [Leptospira semungkisensis]TGK07790.1 ComF family protein [Leptospira semungkisensis]
MKIKVLERLLNIFFPILCGICGKEDFFSLRLGLCGECIRKTRGIGAFSRCNVCSSPLKGKEACVFCDSRNIFFDRALSIRDRNDLLSEILNRLKSRKEFTLSIFLSSGSRKILRKLKELEFDACVILPSFKKRSWSSGKERPFLASSRLCKEARDILGIPFIQPLLKSSAEKQAGKSFSERFFHAYRSWKIHPSWENRCPSRILLLDDVFTTGASVNEASRVLKQNGAKSVYVLTYLRTVD